jgi:hypothetical protein
VVALRLDQSCRYFIGLNCLTITITTVLSTISQNIAKEKIKKYFIFFALLDGVAGHIIISPLIERDGALKTINLFLKRENYAF